MSRESRRFAILEELDVFEARRAGRELARSLGFASRDGEELVLIISELATNIVKYGVRGDITLDSVDDPPFGPGIRVTARDIGPPFANLEVALADGCSGDGPIDPLDLVHRRGIAAGLGAVVRLSDVFEHQPGRGEKRLFATRYLKRPKRDQNASSTGSHAMSANTPK